MKLTFGKYQGAELAQVPASYLHWVATHGNVLSIVNRHFSKAAQEILQPKKEEKMKGIVVYNGGLFDQVNSVRQTARLFEGPFTNEEMFCAIETARDESQDNFGLNQRRINMALATLSSQLGNFELTEISEHTYQVS